MKLLEIKLIKTIKPKKTIKLKKYITPVKKSVPPIDNETTQGR